MTSGGMAVRCAPRERAASTAAAPSAAAVALFRFLRQERRSLAAHLPDLPPELASGLSARLDELGAEDLSVGVADAERIHCSSGLAYQEVFAAPEMTVCIFLMRAGARIPLHDHPGMHVFGRLLFGRMRVVSYDPEVAVDGLPGTGWAKLCSDQVLGPAPTTYSLGPENGNIHELEALEPCAFFDVLTPSYDARLGRDCTYFRRDRDDGAGRCILVPVDLWDFSMQMFRYRGPAFTA